MVNFNSAYATQSAIITRLIDKGQTISRIAWYEIDGPSAIPIIDPSHCTRDRLQLDVYTAEGVRVEVAFDLTQDTCTIDKESFKQFIDDSEGALSELATLKLSGG